MIADSYVARTLTPLQDLQNSTENKCYECIKCVNLEHQLEEAHNELISYQLLVKLLHKKIKGINSEKMQRYDNSVTRVTVSSENTFANKNWSYVETKIPCNKQRISKLDNCQKT
jgi:hypothetical protein